MGMLLNRANGGREVLDSNRPRPVKNCTQCKEDKSLAEFIKMGITRHSMCDPCRKVYMKRNNDKRAKLKRQRLW